MINPLQAATRGRLSANRVTSMALAGLLSVGTVTPPVEPPSGGGGGGGGSYIARSYKVEREAKQYTQTITPASVLLRYGRFAVTLDTRGKVDISRVILQAGDIRSDVSRAIEYVERIGGVSGHLISGNVTAHIERIVDGASVAVNTFDTVTDIERFADFGAGDVQFTAGLFVTIAHQYETISSNTYTLESGKIEDEIFKGSLIETVAPIPNVRLTTKDLRKAILLARRTDKRLLSLINADSV